VRQHPWDSQVLYDKSWNYQLDGETKFSHPRRTEAGKKVFVNDATSILLLKPRQGETPGHTAFLTFAKKKIPLE
jgi:hypothetical protein